MSIQGGAETTREEDVVFSEPVQRAIDEALDQLFFGPLTPPYNVRVSVRDTARRVLENLVWKCIDAQG